MPWLVIRLRHLLCSCQSCPIPSRLFPLPALPALPSPPFPSPPLTLSLPSLLEERTTCPFCCPCPGWDIRLRHLLCSCQSCPIPSRRFPLPALPALPSPPFPPPPLTSLSPFPARGKNYMRYPSTSPCPLCCPCLGWSSGCAIYSAAVSPLPPFPSTCSPGSPLSSSPSPTFDLSLSLPCSRKELHALSVHKSLPFLLHMPWLVIRVRHLLCSCQCCPIPSRLFPLPALPALPSPPFPPPPLTSLSPFPARGKNYMRYPSTSPCPFCCPCLGWSSGCAIYSAAVSPAQSPPAVSLYLLSRLSPLLLSLPPLGKNYMRYPSTSPCLFCCPCPGWSSGCAVYSAAVSPAQSPPAFSLYLLSPLLLSLPHL